MARPSQVSQTGIGSTNWVPVDNHLTPFAIGFGVATVGTVNYTVQHTFDDVQDPTVTPVVFPHETVAAQTANADGNYAFPIQAIRLTVNSGTGTARLRLIQAGIRTG
ncbi:MAG: hypothetical protein V6Z86_05745 [Hyphomicrobiales bacterium]